MWRSKELKEDLIIVSRKSDPVMSIELGLEDMLVNTMCAYTQDTHHLSSKCVKLDTKHQSYASFKVEVTCDNIPDMYDPEKWRVGAYVRRYYNGAAF